MKPLRVKLSPLLRRLAPPRTRLLIATSGGPDSQALLALIGQLKNELQLAEVWAVGIDHQLRPEAPQELSLAAATAERFGIPFVSIPIQVNRQGNLAAQARQGRYAALTAFAKSVGADRIAVAHTATDQAETLLFHLARGAGLRGGAAMDIKRGPIIRPLLGVPRIAIMEYLEEEKIAFAQDPSNHDLRRTRPHIRHHVLPVLRQANPRAEQNILRFTRLARAADRQLTQQARRWLKRHPSAVGSLPCDAIARLSTTPAFYVLRTWLEKQGLRSSSRHLRRLQQACRTGDAVHLQIEGARVSMSHQHLWVWKTADYDLSLAIPAEIAIEALDLQILSQVHEAVDNEETSATNDLSKQMLAQSCERVAFDADRLHLGLKVRPWKPGDKLQPFGLSGHVKVGDLFTNAKIPRPLRNLWPVVTHGSDIVWVVGLRRGNVAPLTASTRRVLTLDVKGTLPWARR